MKNRYFVIRRDLKMVLVFIILFFLSSEGAIMAQWFDDQLPPLPSPAQYGNILIDRTSTKSGEKSVTFSHWSHRSKYTCKVCHSELEFEMKANATEITEEKNKSGQYCGAVDCHDGKNAFGHTKEHCDKCHNGDITYGKEKFDKFANFPSTRFGNKINWSAAARKKLITPKKSLRENTDETPASFNKLLKLEADWNNIPPAVFPHDKHNYWLDCSSCHPDIFNIKKKTTKHFSMMYLLQGKFCGACHLKIAFPMDDCKRCHPGINK